MTAWSETDVHEALVRWGAICARADDGGLGYPAQSVGLHEIKARPYRALEPCEFTAGEFEALERAIGSLEESLKVVVLCYYKPGPLRSAWPAIGVDARGRARSPSVRAIAAFLLVAKHVVEARLTRARRNIAMRLTDIANSDKIAAIR